MGIQIHSYNPERTINWASGTSTELFIHPVDGNFQRREFIFRISTATVEADETTFSDFSGLTRILMILRGKLTLIHQGQYTKELETFDQDTFDGSWKTRSIGLVQDFNVMFNHTCDGEIIHHAMKSGQSFQPKLMGMRHFLFLFDGSYSLNGMPLTKGDLLEFEGEIQDKLQCTDSGNCIEIAIREKV